MPIKYEVKQSIPTAKVLSGFQKAVLEGGKAGLKRVAEELRDELRKELLSRRAELKGQDVVTLANAIEVVIDEDSRVRVVIPTVLSATQRRLEYGEPLEKLTITEDGVVVGDEEAGKQGQHTPVWRPLWSRFRSKLKQAAETIRGTVLVEFRKHVK